MLADITAFLLFLKIEIIVNELNLVRQVKQLNRLIIFQFTSLGVSYPGMEQGCTTLSRIGYDRVSDKIFGDLIFNGHNLIIHGCAYFLIPEKICYFCFLFFLLSQC